jgi:predicted enzyme related to lactoylglutathione lyase
MTKSTILRGLCNVSFWADDVKAARKWYSELLGMDPYFQRPDAENPAYIEFRLGDDQDELGIIDRKYQPKAGTRGPGGVVLYWHVDDVRGALDRLKSMGASEYEPLIEREAGFVTASVLDPFGNVVGLMHSPHYREISQKRGKGA